MLSKNSRLRRRLGEDAYHYLLNAAGAFERLLPHTRISDWTERAEPNRKRANWGSETRREINVCIGLRTFGGKSVHAQVSRRSAPTGVGNVRRTLDQRELDLCRRIATLASETLDSQDISTSAPTLMALRSRFDEDVVADHLRGHHDLTVDLRALFEGLRTLAGQTYENSAIALGCILDPAQSGSAGVSFPADFVGRKKFYALTDGFRTSYMLSGAGGLIKIVDLERSERRVKSTDREFFPEWAGDMARLSRGNRCGVVLTRAGDILVFGDGSLRFTYRFGKWRYLNHRHIVDLLKNLARVQRVAPRRIGAVAKSVYRIALDVSFRRSGGLIVVLGAVRDLRKLVRRGDAIDDERRTKEDAALDAALPGTSIRGISRRVLAELASLDGAVVLANSGKLLAYAAILNPRKKGRIGAAEGSRAKAAIGASNYGLAVKVSADGGIEVFHEGEKALVL